MPTGRTSRPQRRQSDGLGAVLAAVPNLPRVRMEGEGPMSRESLFDFLGYVETSGTIRLALTVCRQCGAVVNQDAQDLHLDWHEKED